MMLLHMLRKMYNFKFNNMHISLQISMSSSKVSLLLNYKKFDQNNWEIQLFYLTISKIYIIGMCMCVCVILYYKIKFIY